MAVELSKNDKNLVEKEISSFCKRVEKEANNHLGFMKLSPKLNPRSSEIETDLLSRNYMSLRFNVTYSEDMKGIYRLHIDVTPRGMLMRDGDRFLPEKIRHSVAQIDPCEYVSINELTESLSGFIHSPGHSYILQEFKSFREALMKRINANYRKKALYIGGVGFSCNFISYEPEQTIAYYKMFVTRKVLPLPVRVVAESAKRISKLDNFSMDLETPKYAQATNAHVDKTKALMEIANAYGGKKKKEKTPKENKINPLKKFKKAFKSKTKDEFDELKKENKKELSLFKSNNIVSIFLMAVPILIFLINIILVLCLGNNFEIKLNSDILWFNEAFTYKLCDLINVTITDGDNAFISILLWICLPFAFVLETLLSLVHTVLFGVVYVLALIYGLGFQSAVGAIIMAIICPVVALILNRKDRYSVTVPIISLVINVILVSLYLLTSYLVVGV